MKDISSHLIAARKLLSQVEQLNANPDLNDRDKTCHVLIDLDMVVQAMLFNFNIGVKHETCR